MAATTTQAINPIHYGCVAERHLQRSPAQPRFVSSLISSMDKDGALSRFRKPKASAILPGARADFISIRPSGSFVAAIFSPGWTPKWTRSSLESVIYRLAVTMNMFKPPLLGDAVRAVIPAEERVNQLASGFFL
jgi:hypothetical protein